MPGSQPPNIERELINRIRRNPEAYRELIVKYQQLVTMIVSGLVPSPDDRADIVQDVFLKVYEHLPAFRFESKLSTWIGRIAYNTCLAFLGKKKHQLLDDLVEDDIPALIGIKSKEYVQPDEIFSFKQTQQLLISAIGQLPPLYRTIVTLYHTHDYSYEEISAICALPIGTVKSYLYRSRRQLKEILLHHVNKEEL